MAVLEERACTILTLAGLPPQAMARQDYEGADVWLLKGEKKKKKKAVEHRLSWR